ncbi:MAG: hypothetical protein AAF411_25070, partial [Myxococcota bacterium]
GFVGGPPGPPPPRAGAPVGVPTPRGAPRRCGGFWAPPLDGAPGLFHIATEDFDRTITMRAFVGRGTRPRALLELPDTNETFALALHQGTLVYRSASGLTELRLQEP